MDPAHGAAFELALQGLPCHFLGEVTAHDRLTIQGSAGPVWIDAKLDRLKAAWQAPLRDM